MADEKIMVPFHASNKGSVAPYWWVHKKDVQMDEIRLMTKKVERDSALNCGQIYSRVDHCLDKVQSIHDRQVAIENRLDKLQKDFCSSKKTNDVAFEELDKRVDEQFAELRSTLTQVEQDLVDQSEIRHNEALEASRHVRNDFEQKIVDLEAKFESNLQDIQAGLGAKLIGTIVKLEDQMSNDVRHLDNRASTMEEDQGRLQATLSALEANVNQNLVDSQTELRDLIEKCETELRELIEKSERDLQEQHAKTYSLTVSLKESLAASETKIEAIKESNTSKGDWLRAQLDDLRDSSMSCSSRMQHDLEQHIRATDSELRNEQQSLIDSCKILSQEVHGRIEAVQREAAQELLKAVSDTRQDLWKKVQKQMQTASSEANSQLLEGLSKVEQRLADLERRSRDSFSEVHQQINREGSASKRLVAEVKQLCYEHVNEALESQRESQRSASEAQVKALDGLRGDHSNALQSLRSGVEELRHKLELAELQDNKLGKAQNENQVDTNALKCKVDTLAKQYAEQWAELTKSTTILLEERKLFERREDCFKALDRRCDMLESQVATYATQFNKGLAEAMDNLKACNRVEIQKIVTERQHPEVRFDGIQIPIHLAVDELHKRMSQTTSKLEQHCSVICKQFLDLRKECMFLVHEAVDRRSPRASAAPRQDYVDVLSSYAFTTQKEDMERYQRCKSLVESHLDRMYH